MQLDFLSQQWFNKRCTLSPIKDPNQDKTGFLDSDRVGANLESKVPAISGGPVSECRRCKGVGVEARSTRTIAVAKLTLGDLNCLYSKVVTLCQWILRFSRSSSGAIPFIINDNHCKSYRARCDNPTKDVPAWIESFIITTKWADTGLSAANLSEDPLADIIQVSPSPQILTSWTREFQSRPIRNSWLTTWDSS